MMEIERIKEKINNLDEAETKSLLMMIYIGLDTAINGNGGQKAMEEILVELFDIYNETPTKK